MYRRIYMAGLETCRSVFRPLWNRRAAWLTLSALAVAAMAGCGAQYTGPLRFRVGADQADPHHRQPPLGDAESIVQAEAAVTASGVSTGILPGSMPSDEKESGVESMSWACRQGFPPDESTAAPEASVELEPPGDLQLVQTPEPGRMLLAVSPGLVEEIEENWLGSHPVSSFVVPVVVWSAKGWGRKALVSIMIWLIEKCYPYAWQWLKETAARWWIKHIDLFAENYPPQPVLFMGGSPPGDGSVPVGLVTVY